MSTHRALLLKKHPGIYTEEGREKRIQERDDQARARHKEKALKKAETREEWGDRMSREHHAKTGIRKNFNKMPFEKAETFTERVGSKYKEAVKNRVNRPTPHLKSGRG